MNRSIYLTAAMIVALTACKQNVIVENNAATAPGTTANVAVNEPGATNAVTSAGKIDTDFVTSSIEGDTAEIAIGQLASTKGSTRAARDLGQMIVTDHGAHKQKLIDLANGAGIAVPTEPAEEGHANLLKLQTLSGAEFDKTFAQMLVDSHHKGIAKNEKQAQSADPKTAALAKETLPVLRKHLAAAEKLQK